MAEILVQGKQFHLRNQHISYIFTLVGDGIPAHVYFGPRLDQLESPVDQLFCGNADSDYFHNKLALEKLPQEYPTFGHGDLRQGALDIEDAFGGNALDLAYSGHEILPGKPQLPGLPASFAGPEEAVTLQLTLTDRQLDLDAVLLYTIFEDCDVVARSVRVVNRGERDVRIRRIMSASVDFHDTNYHLITLSGAWARERHLDCRKLVYGHQGVDSARGASSAQRSPFMALTRNGTDETSGDAYGFALVYSGNHRASVEADMYGMARAQIGINDYQFSWLLEPGEALQAPEAVIAYSPHGLSGMSAAFHALVKRHIVRGQFAHERRPFLLNNWEATTFHFDEEKLLRIAQKGKEAGLEMFVLDDGWFGHRNDDHSSLGDWVVNLEKLPHGLNGLADRIHQMGLRFGLWMEPEMVSPDSDLYRAHPDWCLHQPGRVRTEERWQLTLDMSRPDVCDYVIEAVSNVLTSSQIDYVKWDMNRVMSPVGSALLPPERQRETAHRYMLGLYRVLDTITSRFPHILFESCAAGGNRFDLGMMCFMPQAWCSDNTDAGTRCLIQYGTSLVFPQSTMGAHVSFVPNKQTARVSPLKTRVSVALWGTFGYELDLNGMTEEEFEQTKRDVQYAKDHRDTLLYGDLYRLSSPFDSDMTAWMTVNEEKTEAVVTAVRMSAKPTTLCPRLCLRGLAPKRRYTVAELNLTLSGEELMQYGLPLAFDPGDYQSLRFTLNAADLI